MTLTVAQSSRDYRARRKAKLERLAVLEREMQWIIDRCAMLTADEVESWKYFCLIEERARKALGDVG